MGRDRALERIIERWTRNQEHERNPRSLLWIPFFGFAAIAALYAAFRLIFT